MSRDTNIGIIKNLIVGLTGGLVEFVATGFVGNRIQCQDRSCLHYRETTACTIISVRLMCEDVCSYIHAY